MDEEVPILNIEWPEMHSSIYYDKGGLYAKENIPAGTVIIKTLSCNTISDFSVLKFLSYFGIDIQMKLTLYVMMMQNMRDRSSIDIRIQEWLKSNTSGFVKFSHKLMKYSNNQQIFTEYLGTISHYQKMAQKLYLNSQLIDYLRNFIDIENQQNFMEMLIRASQFRGTRAFGHTKQCMLIPGMDYINYDPSKDCSKIKFVTYDVQNEIQIFDVDQNMRKMSIGSNFESQYKQQKSQSQEENDSEEDDSEVSMPQTKKYISLIVTKMICAGQQLLFDYGGLSNYDLLRYYGYSVQNNPGDKMHIYISDHPQEKMVHFSKIQRSTTKYILNFSILNMRMIDHLFGVVKKKFNIQNNMEILYKVVEHMQQNRPPCMDVDKIQELMQEKGFEYVFTYLQEQAKIYTNQIQMLIRTLTNK